MSEYCYQCLECGHFKEDCICKRFSDPMAQWRDMSESDLIAEMKEIV